jgi:hypothetical protein
MLLNRARALFVCCGVFVAALAGEIGSTIADDQPATTIADRGVPATESPDAAAAAAKEPRRAPAKTPEEAARKLLECAQAGDYVGWLLIHRFDFAQAYRDLAREREHVELAYRAVIDSLYATFGPADEGVKKAIHEYEGESWTRAAQIRQLKTLRDVEVTQKAAQPDGSVLLTIREVRVDSHGEERGPSSVEYVATCERKGWKLAPRNWRTEWGDSAEEIKPRLTYATAKLQAIAKSIREEKFDDGCMAWNALKSLEQQLAKRFENGAPTEVDDP